jgi:hypothetical protein
MESPRRGGQAVPSVVPAVAAVKEAAWEQRLVGHGGAGAGAGRELRGSYVSN